MGSYIYKVALHVHHESCMFMERGHFDIYVFLKKSNAMKFYNQHKKCIDTDYCGATFTKETFNLSPRNNLRMAIECQCGGDTEVISAIEFTEEDRQILKDKETKELEG